MDAPTIQANERLSSEIQTLRAQREHLLAEVIRDPRSPQLREFWTEVHEVADEHSMCDVFDRVAREMGGRPRTDDYDVRVMVTVRVPVTLVQYEQRSSDDAIAAAQSTAQTGRLHHALVDQYGLNASAAGDLAIANWDAETATIREEDTD